jgi:hypothetical protein
MDKRKRNHFFEIVWPYSYQQTLTEAKTVNIIAFDTETQAGLCKLICDSDNNFTKTDSFEDCVSFLSRKHLTGKTNLFFNIDYDFFSIIKYLPEEYLETLYRLNECKIDDIELTWIPSKWFCIKKKGFRYDFFDIYQFYNSSLNFASDKYLNKKKIDYDVVQLLKYETWLRDFERIKIYCINDCKLTKELGDLIASKFLEIGLSFKKPYSIANLSAQWVRRNCTIPKTVSDNQQFFAFQSYFGGRFEIFKKGYFPKVYEIDINSAYPYQIVNLLDITNGKWKSSGKILEDADIGFIKCKISVEDKNICPLPFETPTGLIFPNMKEQEKFITLDEYQFIKEHYQSKIEPISGWYFYARERVYPFEKFKDVYRMKDEVKYKDEMLYRIYKILLNSFYGKTIEIKYRFEKLEQPSLEDSFMIETPNEQGLYIKTLECGKFFNPIYASLITSRTRLQLLEYMFEHKDSCVASFTDSIFLEDKPSNLGKGLGDWDLKGIGELLMIQCGVYTFRTDKEVKTRFRGFNDSNSSVQCSKCGFKGRCDTDTCPTCGSADIDRRGTDFIKWFAENPRENKLSKVVKRPQSLGETLTHKDKLALKDFNAFIDIDKSLNINADSKRIWDRNAINCKDLLENVICSKPIALV